MSVKIARIVLKLYQGLQEIFYKGKKKTSLTVIFLMPSLPLFLWERQYFKVLEGSLSNNLSLFLLLWSYSTGMPVGNTEPHLPKTWWSYDFITLLFLKISPNEQTLKMLMIYSRATPQSLHVMADTAFTFFPPVTNCLQLDLTKCGCTAMI